jgi:hypothetical protein
MEEQNGTTVRRIRRKMVDSVLPDVSHRSNPDGAHNRCMSVSDVGSIESDEQTVSPSTDGPRVCDCAEAIQRHYAREIHPNIENRTNSKRAVV